MAKRLVRAKHKIRAAGIPYRVPPAHLLGERLGGVLGVVYLLFNEGYAASSGAEILRRDLCDEAIRVARLLTGLMPGEVEVLGLTALLLLQDSRRDARSDADGNLVTLEDQDRSRWDRAKIDEGLALLARTGDVAGPYGLQARIAACHAVAGTAAETDWSRIAALYGRLASISGSPVVELNRAVAVAMAEGPEAGLALIDVPAVAVELEGYHLLHATRADLLRRLGRTGEARAAYDRALDLAQSDRDRAFLRRRRDGL